MSRPLVGPGAVAAIEAGAAAQSERKHAAADELIHALDQVAHGQATHLDAFLLGTWIANLAHRAADPLMGKRLEAWLDRHGVRR